MINDPIVEEIRKHRQEHAERYGFDLRRIAEALRDREKDFRRVINPGPKYFPTPEAPADESAEPAGPGPTW